MGWQKNRDTVITNAVQQSCSVLLFLTVPNLLHVEGYAQVVFVTTLLAFMTFADFGLSFVYGRKMPSIYASGDARETQRWNETVFTFRMVTALLFGMAIGLIYYLKYLSLLNSILLGLMPVLSVFASFFIAQHTALSSFATYKKINSFQAVSRLVTMPGVMLFGLGGWFASQLVAALLTITRIVRLGGLPRKLRIDSGLLKEHFVEGVLLGIVTTLWTQLLASGKVFASFMYADVEIAQYGLMNTGYQIVAALIIAAFIPQTVKVYRMIEASTADAIAYTFRTIFYAIPVVFLMAVISREVSPFVFSVFFPKYTIDPTILDSLIFSLAFYPVIVTLGTILIAKKKSISYLLLIAFSLAANWAMLFYLEPYFGFRAAAVAQFCTLSLYSTLLILLVLSSFKEEIKNKGVQLAKILGSLSGLFFFYFLLR